MMATSTTELAMRKLLITLATVFLTACGGGGSEETISVPQSVPAQAPVRTDLLVIGNSITRHGPLAEINWHGDWGMAANTRDRDFAHQIGTALGLPVTAINAADLERDPDAPVPIFPVSAGTVVVIELGDNGLPAKYAKLTDQVKSGVELVCISTYWEQPERDAVIKAECEKVGGKYVYIGDIYPTRQDVMVPDLHPFVIAHPGDWSMSRIAERALAVLN